MPHDMNGARVDFGSIVSMRFKVPTVYATADVCNAVLEAIGGPDDGYHPVVTCDTKMTKVEANQEWTKEQQR